MSNTNNTNSLSAQNLANTQIQSSQQKGISLLKPITPLASPSVLFTPSKLQQQQVITTFKNQSLTDRVVSPQIQIAQNNINQQGGTAKIVARPSLPHQIATSPKPSVGNLLQTTVQNKTQDESAQNQQSNQIQNNSTLNQFQVVSITSRNISPQQNTIRQQRFYSPTPLVLKETSNINDQQQTKDQQSSQVQTIYKGIPHPSQNLKQQLPQQYPRFQPSAPSSNSASKQTTLNTDRTQIQINSLVSQQANLGEKGLIQNQVISQRLISPPHQLNPALKPQLNSQATVISIQKGSNNQHMRSQTQVAQQGVTQIQNSFTPANNIIIYPQVQQYQVKPVENIIQNNSQLHSQQKQSISENLTGSENQQLVSKYSQDLTHSNNAKIILVNSQSKNYIVSNLIHSQSSPNKGLNKVPLGDKNVIDQKNLKQIDSSNLSPEAKKLYEMIGKYNISSKDNSQNNENKSSNIVQNIQRSQSPTERFTFGQKEIKIIQPISSLSVYPQTKIIPTQILTQSPVHIIPNTSLVDAQKMFQTPVSHSLDAKRNTSTHKSAKSSRSVSQDNENKNNLSIVIEVNSATKNRRIIEGSPVRSQSPAVIQGGQPMIQNSPAIRKTHYYKKGNRTLTLQEVLQEKQKEAEEKLQTCPNQENQISNKFSQISPLKYDSIIENNDDRINQNKNYLSYNQNYQYSTESNNNYSTNQQSSAFNTNYQSNQPQNHLKKNSQSQFADQNTQLQLQQEQVLKQQRESLEQQKNQMIQVERKAQIDSYETILKEGKQQEIEMKQQFEKQQREFAQKIKLQQEEFQRQLQIEQERRASSQDSQLKESQLKESQLKLQLEKQQHEYLAKIQQEQLEFQKHFLVQQAEQKQLIESQLIKESQMKEQKLKEQIERQQYEQQIQQQKYQEEKLRLEREQQELQRNLQNQAKELEKIKLQIEQDKKKEVEEQLRRQQENQQKQFDKLSQQQQNLILQEQEIQRQKELEQKKYIEQQQQQFQLMLQAQQQMSAEERKQFKEIYNQQQEELKKLQTQQLEQQKQFAEQLQSIIKQHNSQLENLKKEQDQQTKDLKEMLLNQSRSQQGSPQNANDSLIIFEKLREEKEQLMKQQVEQALQLERQKQELKEKEFKMMQEQQQILLQQQAQQLELLRKRQAEQEEQQQKLQEQKQILEHQFNEYKSKSESSPMNSYEMSNSDRVEMQIYDGKNRQTHDNRREVEIQRAVEIPQECFDSHQQDEEEEREKYQLQNKQTIKYKDQQPAAGQKQGVQEIAELYRELEDQGFEITDQNWQTQKRQNQQSENGDKKNKLAAKQGYKTQEGEEENAEYQEQMRQKQQSTDRNTENQRNGDYINLYSSSNNSRGKQITEDEEANRRKYQHEGYEETYSQEAAEEGENHRQQYQDEQNHNNNFQDKQSKSNKNAQLSEQLLQIEQEIQRLQFEEQQARSQNNQNARLNKKNKNLHNRDGVVPEENEEDYQSSTNKKKKKLTTKNQQIIYADEKKQRGSHKIYKNNQVEKSSSYVPGQRLYEYALEKTKRKEEIKKLIDQERVQKEIEQCTFNPRLVSTNRYFDEFHSRNDKWMKQKEINIDQKTNFEKEKEVRECTFHPEFYTPNKFSSQYTNVSNDPTSLYKRQMEWKNRVEAEIYRQKEENEIMIKERSNEIFNSGRQRSQMMNSPPKNSEYEVVGQINYSQRLNKILSSCRKKNSGNFNEDYQSMDQNSYQQYNQQNQNFGYNQDLQESQVNQNNLEKGENIIKSVTRPINLEENYDLVSHIQGIMRQSNYCKQNIELDQMIAQQNKLQRSQFGNSNIDKRFDSSSKKNSHKASLQGSDYIISKEEIKQKQFERLNEDIQQNKQIEVTKYPILAERKEYSQVIGNVFVQKNKYVLACQADPYLNQPQHYVNFSFDNQQQQNQNLIEQYQNEQLSQQNQDQQKHEQMIIQQNIEANLNQQQQNSQLQGGNSSAYYVADRKYQVVQQQTQQQVPPQFIQDEIERRIQVSKTSNGDEIEELITNENHDGLYSLPNTLQNTQHENYERVQITNESDEVL
ncbi:CDP-alcohol phosphatidyltransferase family protein (macronuclear) [Tetrahymena thermophila SB210]|uniref:CDP-alcohol phosphatidyltransferase family protein n=1 Tax=Tetrahymena thermophila (strain SB210) TaxID=312017 RepID=Q22GV3_TETTS|nr:CDP-alcohol phosphatidyltransferase family protein [Tetrahymena thermophila SB210]EAR84571.3 CDP-alcohol phosphatidyltransferase family protein [Tetrahymena thermophila SB210]|eukprot:XP_001032234.3 CDP-alcohol phosphatidyltransferase family protein [Tetrahymena thermophila SB210]